MAEILFQALSYAIIGAAMEVHFIKFAKFAASLPPMSDIAICVDNLSKLYHISALPQRPDTPSAALKTGLRDALTSRFRRGHQSTDPPSTNSHSDDLWALKDVSFEVKRGEVVGTPALASGASVIGRNGAGTLAPARSAGEVHPAQDPLALHRAHQWPGRDLRSIGLETRLCG